MRRRRPRSLDKLLTLGDGTIQAPRGQRALPPPVEAPPGYALSVYRCQLVEERTIAVPDLRVRTTAQCARIFWQYMGQPSAEVFVVLMLDGSNSLLGISTVAMGDHTEVFVSAAQVYKPAILRNASRIIVGHNHVEGPAHPSSSDKKLTKVLDKAGDALGILLCDHIIVGRTQKDTFSFLDAGLLPEDE